jgi:hypothetical protein
VIAAREYLDGARHRRPLADLPPTVLLREAAEARRLLRDLLGYLAELNREAP